MKYRHTCTVIFSILLIFNVVFIQNVYGQQTLTSKSKSAIKAYEQGLERLKVRDYTAAEQFFNKAIDKDDSFIEAYLMMGELFIEQQKPEPAIKYYSKGISVNPSFYPPAYLVLGNLYLSTGAYSKAKLNLDKFLAANVNNTRFRKEAQTNREIAVFGMEATKNPVPFNPINLGNSINTSYDDYWPSLSADENTLIYTVLLPKDTTNPNIFGNRQEDFFIAQKKDGEWKKGHPAGQPLNTYDNEGAQTITADGKWMFFTACNRSDGEGLCDIYFSRFEKGVWSNPVNLGPPVNTSKKETQPTVSGDGRTLYFASNRPGGQGGLDIWVSHLSAEGKWTSPKNLGKPINTIGDDMSPFIHLDNQTLYFSSNKHLGLGGFDMFQSIKNEKGEWSKPKNLGYPLNTYKDEIGLVLNAEGNLAFFSSDRKNEGNRDIYQFEMYPEARPTPVSYMKGIVFDALTRKRLKAKFELNDLETGDLVSQAYSDPSTGEFLLTIPINKEYALNVEKKDYLFFSENFELTGVYAKIDPFLKNVPLKPLLAGEKIILKNIFFETDSYTLADKSRTELNTVTKLLEKNPTLEIEISGHTDNVGTKDYNKTLSEQRANSVVEYLISKGIESSRLSYKGFGMDHPVDDNNTEEGRANNRRTELKIQSL